MSSLYGNFTLREWLTLHCVTEDVYNYFRKSLKDHDEPMAVLALTELYKRGDVDLIVKAMEEATKAKSFILGSKFAIVFANALKTICDRNPNIKRINENVACIGHWPDTTMELVKGTEFANREGDLQNVDKRLSQFLERFMRSGWYTVEFGFFTPVSQWDSHFKEHDTVNEGEHYNLIIKNGFILDKMEILNVVGILDDAGITEPLPVLEGKEMEYYTLDDNGNWINSKDTEKKNFFYVSYYSLG